MTLGEGGGGCSSFMKRAVSNHSGTPLRCFFFFFVFLILKPPKKGHPKKDRRFGVWRTHPRVVYHWLLYKEDCGHESVQVITSDQPLVKKGIPQQDARKQAHLTRSARVFVAVSLFCGHCALQTRVRHDRLASDARCCMRRKHQRVGFRDPFVIEPIQRVAQSHAGSERFSLPSTNMAPDRGSLEEMARSGISRMPVGGIFVTPPWPCSPSEA